MVHTCSAVAQKSFHCVERRNALRASELFRTGCHDVRKCITYEAAQLSNDYVQVILCDTVRNMKDKGGMFLLVGI